MSFRVWFTKFAKRTARATGQPGAFLLATLVIVAWLTTGPFFHYSDTWQLVINTGTTVVTFLMAERAREDLRSGKLDTGVPEVRVQPQA